MRLLRWGAWSAAALVVGIASASLWYRQASQPIHEGTLRLQGLAATVDVRRDEHGIPTIVAGSERDASVALGFIHAQDRLWQMEFNRRLAAGRLAEVLGAGALPTDKFLRTLGVYRAARRVYDGLDGEHRALIDAYVAGVNAYLETRGGPLPPEFILTGTPAPQAWTAADSLAWSYMMAWDLASHSMRMELRRLRLAQHFTRAEIDDFYPPLPEETAPQTADYVEVYRLLGTLTTARALRLDDALAEVPGVGLGAGEGIGSNNWVLSGRRTVSGKPLLANDPHLGLTTPSVWYFARIETPGQMVAGATLPGLPGIVLGRNDRVAWGVTNTGVDQQDLYLERLVAGSDDEYETPIGPRRFGQRVERFRVKGEADVEIVVRETRHGPVLSGLESIDKSFKHPQFVLALHWSALEPDDRTWVAIRSLNRARSLSEAERALSDFQIVTQSFVLADVDGNIGFVVAGRIPVRRPDNDLHGIAPAPGWDERYDWQAYLPYEQAPRNINPSSGFAATANNRVTPPMYPHHLTYDWFPSYRVRRIEQLIDGRERHDVASTQAIQADVVSLAARDFLGLLASADPLTSAGREALSRLKAWDGSMSPARPEPLLFHAWRRELALRVFTDDFGDLAQDFVANADLTLALLHVLQGRGSSRDWCDDRRTAQRFETCTALMSESLDAVVTSLAEDTGHDVAGLRWGEAHRAVAEHRPFSSVAALARLFQLETPYPGDTYTINVGALSHRPEAPFSTRHAASLRAIYDLDAAGRSLWIHPAGQVGNPFSSLYSSMLPLWRDVDYLPMHPGAKPVSKLVLQPRR